MLSDDTSAAEIPCARPAPADVRLANEYSVTWPLWTSTSPGVTAPEQWGLSPALTARLHAWARVFAAHYDDVVGWRDLGRWPAYREEAFALARAVHRELGGAPVLLDLWEVGGLPADDAVPVRWRVPPAPGPRAGIRSPSPRPPC